jgi:hypothetical protein
MSGCDTCGNDAIDGGEECDGSDLGDQTCEGLGYGGGDLACVDCSFDESGCDPCGNDVIDSGEDCDGTNLGGTDCVDLGYGGGTLACADCAFDESACDPCGNGTIDTGEECDGTNLGGTDCVDLGYGGGTLACTDCAFDESACDPCGNGTIDTGEECDGTNLGGTDCVDLGYGGGTLACTDCAFDESGCDTCGNRTLDIGEDCDGSDLGGETCTGLGFDGGVLDCNSDCSFDRTGCGYMIDLATWWIPDTCNSSTPVSGTSLASGVTVPPLSQVGLTPRNFAHAFVADNWPSGPRNPGQYFLLGVTAGSGRSIAYLEFEFSLYNNYSGVSDWEIRSIVDGYSSVIDSGTATSIAAGGQHIIADVSSVGTRTGTVWFRFYTYNNSGTTNPLQRGFRDTDFGGVDPIVRGILF